MIDWDKEATYIERTVALDETPAEFHGNDATLQRYCVMQYHRAVKAGATAAAERIEKAIRSEWPRWRP